MENRYYTSFWNYVKTGTLDNSDAANDWKKMGINPSHVVGIYRWRKR